MARKNCFSLGVDYGTNSCRALIVDTTNGREIASAVFPYPTGTDGVVIDKRDPNVARQNPKDYIDGFVATVRDVLAQAADVRGFSPDRVVGIGVDTTGSTPIPVDEAGTPLCYKRTFARNKAAMAWLWKDHTAFAEAAEMTEVARKAEAPYLAKCGGIYSSEWFWSKILHCERVAPDVFEAAFSWVEACDFIPAVLCGNPDPLSLKRSVCAAGHKAMYSDEWGGLPDKRFLQKLSKGLAALRDRLYDRAYASDTLAGRLCSEMALKVGLCADIPVAVGGFDAHYGAVGSGVKSGTLVKILGTSTCDLMVAPARMPLTDIPGVCGMVKGSVVPGMIGIEAGQSAVGDIFKWYVEQHCPAAYAEGDGYANLARAAAKLKPGESGLLALDWNNGNRTVLVDPLLSGLVLGQTLHTTAPEVYRALLEATAFGALTIINRIEAYGVKVCEIVNCGGLAEKMPLLMQIYADVCNRPMKVSRSAQTCALGAAIFGAVVGKAHRNVESAQTAMTGIKTRVYRPKVENVAAYHDLYALYVKLHDAFGVGGVAVDCVMKSLIAIRGRVRAV